MTRNARRRRFVALPRRRRWADKFAADVLRRSVADVLRRSVAVTFRRPVADALPGGGRS